MKYTYLAAKPDYSDFASGQVLFGAPGRVATPLRLVDELFQTGVAAVRAAGHTGPLTLYDPCCGTAYHLAALGFLHRPALGAIIASDADAEVVAVAAKNLHLLSLSGLDERLVQLHAAHARFGKDSHLAALAAAARLRARLGAPALASRAFCADALDGPALLGHLPPASVHLALADVPYGLGSQWSSPSLAPAPEAAAAVGRLLDALWPLLLPGAAVCLLAAKGVKVAHPRFESLRRQKAGKRAALVLRPIA